MRKLTIGITLLLGLLSLAIGSNVFGLSETVVISAVQVRTAASSTSESITLANNTPGDIDLTNWCLQYATSSTSVSSQDQVSWRELACFTPADEVLHIMLPPHQSATAVSRESGWTGDLTFSATLANTSGHVRVIDGNGNEIDKLAWGDARYPEGQSTATPLLGQMLIRNSQSSDSRFDDTDNNRSDFAFIPDESPDTYGRIYETRDICSNIEGFQLHVPTGYILLNASECYVDQDVCLNLDGTQPIIPISYDSDGSGNCVQDVCANIDGIQIAVVDNTVADGYGNCMYTDSCVNVTGLQVGMPEGYFSPEPGICSLVMQPLIVNEVLANPDGNDSGKEFIELYNPNQQPVSLKQYILSIGKNYEYTITFSGGAIIPAHGYTVLQNNDFHFTLANTTTRIRISSIDGQTIYESPSYQDPKENISWAFIDEQWQYTNQPTPGSENIEWLDEPKVISAPDVVQQLKPCAVNQYRNPATHRCKTLSASSAILTDCKQGQYRSPETNRCRNIVTATEQLTPCKAGQERSLETNRCRKATDGNVPKAEYGVLSEKDEKHQTISYVIIAVIVVASLGGAYAVWEWRHDIARFGVRLWRLIHFWK